MTPLPPDAIYFTMQSGIAADALLLSTVSVMNGLINQETTIEGVTSADPRFLRALTLLRKIQLSGAVGMRVLVDAQNKRSIRVGFSRDKPDDAYVAVAYHGGWFWIDDRDLTTKRAFPLIMMLFTLADTGAKEALPLITIPAG